MHSVKRINHIDGYKISLTFEDNETKIIDTEPYLDTGIFLDLRDAKLFNKVRVQGSTIVWPNDADFCPDVLYEIGVKQKTITKTIRKKVAAKTQKRNR